MELPNLKELKRLADMCRKAGISHFKSDHFEFTLTEEAPVSNYKKAKESITPNRVSDNKPFESDSLGEDELLYWSTGNLADSLKTEE